MREGPKGAADEEAKADTRKGRKEGRMLAQSRGTEEEGERAEGRRRSQSPGETPTRSMPGPGIDPFPRSALEGK